MVSELRLDSKQIRLSASNRGITDHFFCFTCDDYVWHRDRLIEERLSVARIPDVLILMAFGSTAIFSKAFSATLKHFSVTLKRCYFGSTIIGRLGEN
jgi:hypothetical protein